MSSGAVRLVSLAPRAGHSHTILIVALLLLPAISPMSAVNGEARFELIQRFQKVRQRIDRACFLRKEAVRKHSERIGHANQAFRRRLFFGVRSP